MSGDLGEHWVKGRITLKNQPYSLCSPWQTQPLSVWASLSSEVFHLLPHAPCLPAGVGMALPSLASAPPLQGLPLLLLHPCGPHRPAL